MHKIIITGANGQLGSLFKKQKSKKHKFYFFDKKKLDILDKKKIHNVFKKIKPNFIINAAAYTNVKNAESISYENLKCNYDGVLNLLETAKKFNTFFIHISSDYVFDGLKKRPYKETDKCLPINQYGKSKLLGEKKITDYDYENYVIIRTSWLYSDNSNNFLNLILEKINNNQDLMMVKDLKSNPTSVNNLFNLINTIINDTKKIKKAKILHFRDFGNAISPYDFANFVLKIIKIKKSVKSKIIPVLYSKYQSDICRPLYSSLSINYLINNINFRPQHWKVEVAKILDIKRL